MGRLSSVYRRSKSIQYSHLSSCTDCMDVIDDRGYSDFRPRRTSLGLGRAFSTFFSPMVSSIKDGAKISKSRGNTVIPDEYIEKYGTDTLRTYLMFLGPFDHGGDFRDSGIAGMYRFLARVWRLVENYIKNQKLKIKTTSQKSKIKIKRRRKSRKI